MASKTSKSGDGRTKRSTGAKEEPEAISCDEVKGNSADAWASHELSGDEESNDSAPVPDVAHGEADSAANHGIGVSDLASEHSQEGIGSAGIDSSYPDFVISIVAHDLLRGIGYDTGHIEVGSDDFILSGPGIEQFDGMFGFDWAISKYDLTGVFYDFGILTSINDRDGREPVWSGIFEGYDLSRHDDDNAVDAALEQHPVTDIGNERIAGLSDLIDRYRGAGGPFSDSNDGNATFETCSDAAGSNIPIAVGPDVDGVAPPIAFAESLAELVPYILNGSILPSQVTIVSRDGPTGSHDSSPDGGLKPEESAKFEPP